MKKGITFRTWITVFFGGIWQFICTIFSWKNKTPFWRVVWAVITICVVAVTAMLGYAFYEEFYVRAKRYAYYNECNNISDHYNFFDKGRNGGKSYIRHVRTGEKVLTGLDWVALPEDGDSLIVFAKDGKRGFFNRYTGKVDIPAVYDAAWCFNDGVAGVCTGDSIFFIDRNGSPVNNHRFLRQPNRNYVYYGNYFAFVENGKAGLIDRNGDIAFAAGFDDIIPAPANMWIVKSGELYGAINADGKQILPCEYKDVTIYQEGGVVVAGTDNTKKRFDYDGSVTDNFVYDNVYLLQYSSDKFDTDGNRIPEAADLYVYTVGYYRGLMDKNGHPVTMPLYSGIAAISADLYDCCIADTNESVILNSKGEKVND